MREKQKKKLLGFDDSKVVGVIPTGWVCSTGEGPAPIKAKRKKTDSDVFRVPYSIHSSFPEMVEFVNRMQPQRLIPIVDSLPFSRKVFDLPERIINKDEEEEEEEVKGKAIKLEKVKIEQKMKIEKEEKNEIKLIETLDAKENKGYQRYKIGKNRTEEEKGKK